ncbi:MAG: hypothetical protein J5J00_12970 [Deltaproteobacteria bacterium]|nr:hypothetical protein [Deltaproteobacteria bacterium]
MKTLWELTRGISKVVGVLLGRITRLEKRVASQERRIAEMEGIEGINLHSMEVKQEEIVEREEVRREGLSEQAYKHELESQYGDTKWAKKVINEMIGERKKKAVRH